MAACIQQNTVAVQHEETSVKHRHCFHRLVRLQSIATLLTLCLLAAAFAAPAEARPWAERVAERRLARAEQAAARAEIRLERFESQPAASAPAQSLRPGVVRRLLRQGMTPEEITRITGAAAAVSGDRTARQPVAARGPQPAAEPEQPRQFLGGQTAQPLTTAETSRQTARPPAGNDRAVQAAAGNATDGTRSVLVTGAEPAATPTDGPVFPGLAAQKTTDGEPAAVVTHEPVELLPTPKPQQQ